MTSHIAAFSSYNKLLPLPNKEVSDPRSQGGDVETSFHITIQRKPKEDLKRNLKYRIFRRVAAFHRSAFSPLIDWNIACHKTESERILWPAAGFYAACLRSLKYIWQCVPTDRNGCNMCNGKNGFSVNQTPNRWRRQKRGYFFLTFCFLSFYFILFFICKSMIWINLIWWGKKHNYVDSRIIRYFYIFYFII